MERLRLAAADDIRVEFDPVLAIPSAIYARTGGLPVKVQPGDPETTVKSFLDENRDLHGFGSEVLRSARLLENVAAADPSGFHTIRWQQELDGIPVFQGFMTGILTSQGELINFCSLFVPDVERASGMDAEQRSARYSQPAISVKEALIRAAEDLGDWLRLDQIELSGDMPVQPGATLRLKTPDLKAEASANLVWLPVSRNGIRLCWNVVLMNNADGDLFSLLVNAETGGIEARHGLTSHFQIELAGYRVYTGESPTPFLPAYSNSGNPNQPTNLGTLAPDYVNQIPLSGFGVVSVTGSLNGWIDPGDNRTRGNNVDAYWDPIKAFENDPPEENHPNRPEGSPWRVFHYTADPTQEPTYVNGVTNNPNAAVVNAFYWANWMHDKLYDLGFTESQKNFQSNNFGRGGVSGDRVRILVQHGTGLTPPTRNIGGFDNTTDGTPARLRLSTWRCDSLGDPTPAREGAFDATVILHELTHGLVYRRAGAGLGEGQGITTLESKVLSEGWADFLSLALLAPASEAPSVLDGTYPYGAYSTHRYHDASCNQVLQTDNYYFGMRYFPYSTDMTKDPLTLTDIDHEHSKAINHQTAHHYPVSISPHNREYGNAPTEDEPDGFQPFNFAHMDHRANQIWCSALWDLRANIIKRLGYWNGQDRALRLVVEGMRVGSPNPTILGSRDGIVAVADADPYYPVPLREETWAAFYKRGMGPKAQISNPYAGQRFSVIDQFNRADFDLNGLGDLILQSGTAIQAWSMNGVVRSGSPVTLPSLSEGSWWVVGTTDVNRDGRLDFFLEDNHFNSNGHFLGYRSANGGLIQSLSPPWQGDGVWHIVGTGDFHRTTAPGSAYRDTQPDLLWQKDDGMLAIWYMDGENAYDYKYTIPPFSGQEWRVVGTGDFNRDGVTDIIFQHSTYWWVAVWIMKNDGISWDHSEPVRDMYGSWICSPSWRVIGAAYVNSDDKLDLLLQSGTNLGVWYLDGTIYSSPAQLGYSAGAFSLVGPK